MSAFRLALHNLLFHRRGNFAVFLGVALGTAVLTGALLVGDSLRGSMRDLALGQLGWVHDAMTANRFFREDLNDTVMVTAPAAGTLKPLRKFKDFGPSGSLPILLLHGSGTKMGKDAKQHARSVNKIAVFGVEEPFWRYLPIANAVHAAVAHSDRWNAIAVNQSLATALNIDVGDKFAVHLQKADAVPREFLLGKRRQGDVVQVIELTLEVVLPDQGMATFTLQPNPEPVLNAFVPLHILQEKLGLENRANVLLAGDDRFSIAEHLTLDDWNLFLRSPTDRAHALVRFLEPRSKDGSLKKVAGEGGWFGRVPDELAAKANKETKILSKKDIEDFYRRRHDYFLFESRQLLLEDAVVDAVKKAFGKNHGAIELSAQPWWLCPTFIYLADSISHGQSEISYAVVAAQGPLPEEKEPPLEDNQIDLAVWPGSTSTAKPGDTVTVKYYAPDDHNHLQKLSAKFTVRRLFPLTGIYDDPDLVPEFPGVTDKLDMKDWNDNSLPFPYDSKRGMQGEAFWKRYRTTPRAYISLEKAQQLWGSRFGKLTSYRVMPLKESEDYAASMEEFGKRVLASLDPKAGGFVWQDVRKRALEAGGGSADFGMFFLGFSFYLIVAALLLVGLLFRLNLDLRGREIGVLLALGWTRSQVRRLLLGEGGLLAVGGGFVGMAGALFYADYLLKYLSNEWPGKLQFLRLHVTAESLVIGWTASVVVSFLTILWAVRVLGRMTPTRLLAGDTSDMASAGRKPPDGAPANSGGLRPPLAWIGVAICILLAAGCMIGGFFATGHESRAGSFLGSGFLLLIACLTVVWRWLKHSGGQSNPRQGLAGLAVRNAGRHTVRSVLTVGLLAAAIFLIVAVEAFHKDTSRDFLEKTGGSGGFALFAQADVPIFQDLNAPAVRQELHLDNAEPAALKATFYPCRLRAGDDASCLNLYQPLQPRILGVPKSLIQRGGFSFAGTQAQSPDEKANPWLLLEKAKVGDDAVPIFVDATTAQWTLHEKGLGDIVDVKDGEDRPVKLRIVGLLQGSIFQSELVMAEPNFRRLFPRQEGFSFFLIESPPADTEQIKSAWEKALADNGLSIQTTESRLARYLAVENTYLATFQALGGLGLLLGAVGLAIVLLRSVWERRAELALLRALGFSRGSLAWLVLAENVLLLLVGLLVGTISAVLTVAPQAENVLLLLVGLLVGTISAVLTVAPQVVSGEASLLDLRVLGLLGLVVVVGLAAGLMAVAATLRAPLLQALRHE